ncbi:MAG: hypothetical protein J6B96_08455 [Agathobacter sp.]|nr:hypothetical protein [Agathobacter sp.]
MKKNILVTLIIILMILVGLFALANFMGLFERVSEQQKAFMNELNETNSIVWYYGDFDPGEEVTINYQKLTEFTEETIGDSEEKYAYHAIVIFDFDGEMDISDEELLLIKDYCENKYYDMLYYGTAHMEQFRKCGFFTVMDSSEHGFSYNGSYWMNRSGKEDWLNPYLLTGNWDENYEKEYSKDDKSLVWKFVIFFIVDLIRDSYGEL